MKKMLFAAALAAASILTAAAAKLTVPPEFADVYAVPCTVIEITDRVTIADRSPTGLTWSFDAAETFGCDPFTVGDDVCVVLWDYQQNCDMSDDMVVNVCYDHSTLAQ